ncbi:MAG TPA: RNA-binding protein [Alicycliphilus sp.]|nr:RNA-binding protein [Alicycliphilus sp.]
MNNKLYVGNLAYSVTNETLIGLFSQFGTVASAKVMTDRDTGRSKGFGFVEMDNEAQAKAAIDGTHGKALDGRGLTVNLARPMEPRQGFGGGGDRGGYRNNRY